MAVTAAAKDKGVSTAHYGRDSVLPVSANLGMELDKASGRQLDCETRLIPYKYHCRWRFNTQNSDNTPTGWIINMEWNMLAP
jgi:hypothetical protein